MVNPPDLTVGQVYFDRESESDPVRVAVIYPGGHRILIDNFRLYSYTIRLP